MLGRDHQGHTVGQRTPEYLRDLVNTQPRTVIISTYSGRSLHAYDKWIAGHISRVGKGVFFPHLPKDISHACQAGMIVCKIPYSSQLRNRRSHRMTLVVPSKKRCIEPAVQCSISLCQMLARIAGDLLKTNHKMVAC